MFISLPDPEPVPWDRATWLGLTVLVSLWAFLFAVTWGHWGDLTIDCGREMYVPSQLAHGKTLYTDLWYPYTPGGPYLNSLLFRLFGVHLAVLYWAGALSALGSATLLYLTGLNVTSRMAAWTTGSIVLLEAFVSSEFCFPLPYSYGAVYACLAACFCLWCAVNAGAGRRQWNWMLGAGIAAAAAFLSKQEIGAGCFAALVLLAGVRGVRSYRSGESIRQFGIELAALLPGVLLSLTVIVWMISLGGLEFLTQENLMSWPTSYFMKKYANTWLALTGFSLSRKSLIKMGALAATIAIWCGFRWLRRVPGNRGRILAFGVLLCLGALAAMARSDDFISRSLHLFFPRAAVFLIALAVPIAIWVCSTLRQSGSFVKVALLFSMTVLIEPRALFGTLPSSYSIFYNGPVLLSLFVIMNWLVFPDGSSKAGGTRLVDVLPYLAVLLTVLVDVGPLYSHGHANISLRTPRGVIYAGPDKLLAYRSALDFIDRKKGEGGIMSIPEDTSLYFLAGIEAPTRLYQFGPGVLSPGKMTSQEIERIQQAGVRYLIWSNRTFPEYGVPVFGTDFDQDLAQYFRSHYRPIETIGGDLGWNAVVWERLPDSSPR